MFPPFVALRMVCVSTGVRVCLLVRFDLTPTANVCLVWVGCISALAFSIVGVTCGTGVGFSITCWPRLDWAGLDWAVLGWTGWWIVGLVGVSQNGEYVVKLLKVFNDCEDLDDDENLRVLCNIFKSMVGLNDGTLLEASACVFGPGGRGR